MAASAASWVMDERSEPRDAVHHRTRAAFQASQAAIGTLRVEGLRFGGGRVALDVAHDGTVTVLAAPPDVRVLVT